MNPLIGQIPASIHKTGRGQHLFYLGVDHTKMRRLPMGRQFKVVYEPFGTRPWHVVLFTHLAKGDLIEESRNLTRDEIAYFEGLLKVNSG